MTTTNNTTTTGTTQNTGAEKTDPKQKSKPSLIANNVKKSPRRKISNVPLVIIIVIFASFALGVLVTDAIKPKAKAQKKEDSPYIYQSRTAAQPEVLATAPQAGIVGGRTDMLPHEDSFVTSSAVRPAPQNVPTPQLSPYEQMQLQAWQRQQQEALQAEQERQQLMDNAHESKTTVFSANENVSRHFPEEQQEDLAVPGSNRSGQPLRARASYQNLAASNYLLSTRVQPLSPNEIKAGTIIPAMLVAGINSQLPGDIIAQVTSNVYDTATGQILLIPQGSKLFGRYDHQVVLGQRRVLIAWNRIIYPDASSLDIEGMAGHDQSGYAGFKDKVNNHTWAVFQHALMMSAITAGAQLSQPRSQKGDYSYSSQQVMAASLGMNMNQFGMLTMQNRMNISPTLTIRPGYPFNVMVNKDMILPPWESAANDEPPLYTVAR